MTRANILRRDWNRSADRRNLRPVALELEARTLLSLVHAPGHEIVDVHRSPVGEVDILRYGDARTFARPVHRMVKRAAGGSIQHPFQTGALAAGQSRSFAGAVTKQSHNAFYEIQVSPQEVIHAALSVLQGSARFTMFNGNRQVMASQSLSGSATEGWSFNPGTYYIEVARAGKARMHYQLFVTAANPPAPPGSNSGNPAGGPSDNPSEGGSGNSSGGGSGNTTTRDTATSLEASSLSAVFGQTVTFSASVRAVAPAAGIPTGTVTFRDGSTMLGTAMLDGSGTATWATSSFSVGTHAITASYNSNHGFQSSVSKTSTTTVNQGTTTVLVTSSETPAAWQDSIRFTATINVNTPGAGAPTGQVQFQIDGSNFGAPVPVVNGAAVSGWTSSIDLGKHTITATYSGDGNFHGGAAPGGTLDVEMTEQQFESALDSKIQQAVTNFDNDATDLEIALAFFGGTYAWPVIDSELIIFDNDVNNENYMNAYDYAQNTLGPSILAEAFAVALKGLPDWEALLDYSSIIDDLQALSALKEISYGFLVEIAIATGATSGSTPTAWTTGLLGTGSTDGFLSAANQGIFTSYGTNDLNYVDSQMAYLNADEGELASDDLWYQEAQQFDPNGSIDEDSYDDSSLDDTYTSIDDGDYSD